MTMNSAAMPLPENMAPNRSAPAGPAPENTGSTPASAAPAIEDMYPLSPTQQGMLFHSLYGPDSGVYVVQVGYTVRGSLDLEAFSQAWQWLAQRHPVLRTAFVWDTLEEPLQVVGRQAKLPVSIQDWRQQSASEQRQVLANWLAADRRQGFNLAAAPLMRLTVFRLTEDTYRILWTHHHLLLDGWSVPLLLQELLVGYRAYAQGQIPGQLLLLPKPKLYRNYIAWLKQQDLQAAIQFWQQRLQGMTAPTPLGIDRPRSIKGTFERQASPQHKMQERSLSPQLTTQLRSHAQTHRLTLNTLVQGAWAIVLGRYSGESEVLFGATCAGRPPTLQGAETMVGLFINTLPLRVDVTADQTVDTWLQHLQTQQLEQQPYEYTPLVQIHGSSDIPRSLPLFESIVVFENYPVEPSLKQSIGDFTIEDITTAEQTNYPLTLFAISPAAEPRSSTSADLSASTLDLKVLYDCDRFTPASIKRLLGHLETVLSAFITHSEKTIGTLPLLTPVEYQQLITDWNQTGQAIPERCVHELIADQAQERPDAIAIVFQETILTYRELDNRVNQLAHYLMDQGVKPGERVAVCLERSAELVVALHAILKVGGTYVPLDPMYPAERLRFILVDAAVSLLITANAAAVGIGEVAGLAVEDAFGGNAHPTMRVLDLTSDRTQINRHPIHPSTHPPIHSQDLAYLIYTSGSTGTPKGVPIRHQSLTNLLTSMAQAPGMTAQDTLLAVTTPAFDIAALELFLPLTVGGTLVIASQDAVREPQQLAAQLVQHDVTLMQATPATWRLLLESGWQGKSNLKLLCGGEALEGALAQQLLACGSELWNLYGPTETTIWSAALRVEASTLQDGIVPIGKPIANTEFYVLDSQQRPVPVGVPGELHISGLGVSPGYWRRDDLTPERFIPHPFSVGAQGLATNAGLRSNHIESGLGCPDVALGAKPCAPEAFIYRTGDRVCYQENGTLQYLGRLDHQVKLRGFRIELGEIETVLARHSDMAQAVVMLHEDELAEQQLIAYVVLKVGGQESEIRGEQGTGSYPKSQIPNPKVCPFPTSDFRLPNSSFPTPACLHGAEPICGARCPAADA
ncbi:MAG: amino acid adenylation domain-containing protein [Cyanobacteria bacterium J06626_18]